MTTTTISRASRTQHVVADRRAHVRARPTPPRDTLDQPRALSSFVGGQEQVEAVVERLRSTRLVTLIGLGGVGKTRLAQQIAHAVHGDYERCAWAPLSSIVEPAQIGESVAAALGGGNSNGPIRAETLVQGIRNHRVLLVLDNCEHLIAGCAEMVARVLESCPGLSVVATSREPLNVPGEVVYRVKPLALPNPVEPLDCQMQSAAAKLFVERARARETDLQLTGEAYASVATICHTVKGMPLAIELAASWVGTMTVSEIAARLTEDVLGLRAASPRAVPARQTSLRASLDWSHALLEHAEQRLLRSVAGLVDDFGLDEAVALAAADDVRADDVALLLNRLVGHSLVQATEQRSRMRYSLAAPVRAYYRQQRPDASAHASLQETAKDGCAPAVPTTDLARESPRGAVPGPGRGRPRGLSERERDVVLLIASGRSNRQIADELVITKKTAEAHVSHVLTKLGLCSRVQIATWSVQNGLVRGGGDLVTSADSHTA